jgi:putative membrane protein
MYGGYGGMGYGSFGMIIMFLFWLLAVALLFMFVHQAISKPSSSNETPAEIAKQRYAKGEITKQEFDGLKMSRKKRALIDQNDGEQTHESYR